MHPHPAPGYITPPGGPTAGDPHRGASDLPPASWVACPDAAPPEYGPWSAGDLGPTTMDCEAIPN